MILQVAVWGSGKCKSGRERRMVSLEMESTSLPSLDRRCPESRSAHLVSADYTNLGQDRLLFIDLIPPQEYHRRLVRNASAAAIRNLLSWTTSWCTRSRRKPSYQTEAWTPWHGLPLPSPTLSLCLEDTSTSRRYGPRFELVVGQHSFELAVPTTLTTFTNCS